jgi:hypothetical protein
MKLPVNLKKMSLLPIVRNSLGKLLIMPSFPFLKLIKNMSFPLDEELDFIG